MSSFADVKKMVLGVSVPLKEGNLRAAIASLSAGIAAYVRLKPAAAERQEMYKVLQKTVYGLSQHPVVRQLHPEGVAYTYGKERDLFAFLKDLVSELDTFERIDAERRAKERRKRREEELKRAARLLERGETPHAVKLYRQILREHAGDLDLQLEVGQSLYKAGVLDEALALYLDLSDKRPHDVSLHNQVGLICRKMGKYREAEERIRRALELSGEDAGILFNLGRTYFDARRWDEAYDTLRKALQLNPDFAPARKLLAAVEEKVFVNKPAGKDDFTMKLKF